MSETSFDQPVGVVAIGRNEGERLVRCLRSARAINVPTVYVDSGSTDSSVSAAKAEGCEVVCLDLSKGFSAARARNAGLEQLLRLHPQCQFVQFVDGDCELAGTWMTTSLGFLSSHPCVAVACGRRRERNPQASVYNALCDLEWNTLPGKADSCGGDAMIRIAALHQSGWFNPKIIAGEEPELCQRLRRTGWFIERLDEEMTLHDADMYRFSQWWRRSARAGWAYINGLAMTKPVDRRKFRSVIRPWFWIIVLPAATVALSVCFHLWGLLPLLAYPVMMFRAARYARRREASWFTAVVYGIFSIVGKAAEIVGQCRWIADRLAGQSSKPIEYKVSPAASR